MNKIYEAAYNSMHYATINGRQVELSGDMLDLLAKAITAGIEAALSEQEPVENQSYWPDDEVMASDCLFSPGDC